MLGDDNVLLLLPAAAATEIREGYRQLAQTWSQASSQALEIRWDHAIGTLPADRAVWLFGWGNRFLPAVAAALQPYSAELTRQSVRLEETLWTRERWAAPRRRHRRNWHHGRP